MNLRPLDDKIVIKKIEMEERTASGIVLPSSAKEESNVAEIIALGNKIDKDDDMKGLLKVGDKVVFSKYAGSEIELKKEKYTIIKFADVLAVIE